MTNLIQILPLPRQKIRYFHNFFKFSTRILQVATCSNFSRLPQHFQILQVIATPFLIFLQVAKRKTKSVRNVSFASVSRRRPSCRRVGFQRNWDDRHAASMPEWCGFSRKGPFFYYVTQVRGLQTHILLAPQCPRQGACNCPVRHFIFALVLITFLV